MVNGGLQIPISFNTDGLKQGIDKIKSETNTVFDDLNKKLETLNKKEFFNLNTKQTQKEIEAISNKIKDLENAKKEIKLQPKTADTEKALQSIDNRLKELRKDKQIKIDIREAKSSSLKKIDKQIKDLTAKRELTLTAGKSAKEINRELEAIDNELLKLTKTRELKIELNNKSIENARNSLAKFNQVAKAGAVAVAGIGTSLGLATKQAIEFETQFAEVNTLLGDMPTNKVDALKSSVVELSKETGMLTSEILPALYQAISAGVAPDNVIEFLRTASKNAIGGVTELTTSVDGLTNIVNAYGKGIYDVNTVSDLMFTTMKLGKTTIGELSASYYNVIPTASALGVSFRDISASMSTITSAGVPTSVATTQLRELLVKLGDSSSKVGSKFKELSGKTFKEFIAEGGNLQQALQLLEGEAKANNLTINQLFSSVEAGNAALGLTGANAKKFASDLEAMNNSLGATDEAFKKIDETPARRIAKLRAEFSAFTLELGRSLIPTLEKVMEGLEKNKQAFITLGNVIGKIVSFIANNGKAVVSVITGIGAGIVAMNVALAITQPALFGVAGGLSSVVAGMTALNVSTGGIVVAIGIVVTALTTLILNFDKVKIVINDTLALFGNLEAKMNKFNRQAGASISAYKEQATAMEGMRSEADKLIATYDRLNKKQNKTASENEELKRTIKELEKTFPELAKELEKTGGNFEGIKWNKFLTVDENELAKQVVDATNKAEKALQQAREKLANTEAGYKNAPTYQKGNYEKELEKDREALTKAEQQYNDIKARQDEIIERARRRQQGYIEDTKNAISETEKLTKVQGINNEEYKKAVAGTTKKVDPLKELDKEYKARKKLIDNTIASEDEKNKALEDAEREYQNKRLSIAQNLYVELEKEGKNNTKRQQTRLKELEKITKDSKEKIKELNKPSNKLNELEKQYDVERELIEATVDDEQAKNEAILSMDRNYYNQRLAIQQQLVKEILALTGSEREAREQELQALYSDIKETQSKINELGSSSSGGGFVEAFKSGWGDIANNIANIFSVSNDIVNQSLDNQLNSLENNLEAQTQAIEDKLERETKAYEKQLEALEEQQEARKKLIEDTENEINDLKDELGTYATEEERIKYEEQKLALEEKLTNEKNALASQEQKKIELEEQQKIREEQASQQKLELERQFAIEEAKIKRQQAENDKKVALFQATISMAQAIAQALTLMFPLNIVQSTLMSILGAAQIGFIASQPLPTIPSFHTGGVVKEANLKYYEDIIGKPDNPHDNAVAFVQTGETILTREQSRIYEQTLLNQNHANNSNVSNNNSTNNNSTNVDLHISFNGANINEKRIIRKVEKTVSDVIRRTTRGY